ncbi:MAG TPA: TonB family protein [Thermoanaerobaculia bacterium]|nr:TonB family protein [Thermoanaerobaculia bacterium]
MFASHWTPPQGGRSAGRKRTWILTSSLLLHVVALATLAGAEAWQVRAVAEPPIPEVFEVQLPLPLLPAPPPPPVNEPKKIVADSPPPRSTPAPPLAPLAPPAPMPVQPDPLAADKPIPPPADPQPADPRLAPADVDPFGGGRRGNGNGTGDATSGRGTGDGDDVALAIGGAISRPQIIPGTKVEPRYTEQARQAHLQGVVVLRAVIDERGNVIDIELRKRLRFGLDEEAVKAVSQWKFTPALLNGRPVKVFFDLTVVFEVR